MRVTWDSPVTSQRPLLKYALTAGFAAGLIVGGFHNLLSVPVIEEAIAFEEAQAAVGHAEEPLVSLGAQRVGLLLGQAIFGVIIGALFAGLYALALKALRGRGPRVVAAVTGLAGFWAVALLPALKYSPNPPGVGETETLLFRQGFQLLFLVASFAALAALLAVSKRAWHPGAVAAYLAVLGALFIALPAHPDSVSIPATLLREFRVLSVAGHLLLWLLIAASVPWLARRSMPADDAPP